MPDFQSMFNASQNVEPAAEFAEDLGPNDLEKGAVVDCIISKVFVTKSGTGVNIKLQVLDGEHKGGELFDGIYFPSVKPGATELSAGQLRYAKGMFAKATAAGLDEAFWAAGGNPESMEAALKGQKVTVTIGWEKPDDEGNVWGRHAWAPVAGTPEAYVPQGGGDSW